jgi:hypothetical protein
VNNAVPFESQKKGKKMKAFEKLQKNVRKAVKQEQVLNAKGLDAFAEDGVAVCIGTLQSDPPKPEVETIAKNISDEKVGAENIDDTNVVVKLSDHKVTLTGTVHTWSEKEEAERAAWKAPDAWTMENELEVVYVKK